MEPTLHGREEPMRALRTALDSALRGRGLVALVGGEAGIGKTALATALSREAEAHGATVTWGRAWEFADAPPYFPVLPCLRALGLSPSGDPFDLWERVALALAAQQKPTVWIIEDVHASDLGTLDLLAFLSQPLRAMPVLVIATARANDPRLTDRMQQRLTRIAREGIHIPLEPLADLDVAALTEGTIGRAVPAKDLKKLVELTGGNPLFVVECARAFRAAGGIEGTLGSLPPTIRQVVVERLSHLPRSTQEALFCGAILGREFTGALVAKMRSELPAAVIDALLVALRTGLIVELRPGHFLFSHALVRDAIESALDAHARAALHARAQAALATQPETADVIVERARHALASLAAGPDPEALSLARRAATVMEEAGAFDRALEIHLRIDDARRAGLLPVATSAELLALATVARVAGQSNVMRRVCEDVMEIARAQDDSESFARAVLLYTSDVQPGVVIKKEVGLLEEARTRLGDRVPTLACRLLARYATALQPSPDQQALMRMTRDALAHARATQDAAAILDVLDLAWWGLYSAPLEERIAIAEELRDRALDAKDIPKALLGIVSLALHYTEGGRFGDFERAVDAALALSEEARHPRWRWRPLLLASMRALQSGRFVEADRWVMEVEGLAALVDDAAFTPALVLHDVMRHRLATRAEEMRAALARAEPAVVQMFEGALHVSLLRATCAARVEDEATAKAAIATIGKSLESLCMDSWNIAVLAEAYALAGNDDDRRLMRAKVAELEQREVHGGTLFVAEGTVERLLGLLDAALGDRALAERELREAHRLARERKHEPWIAQIGYELAKLVSDEEARSLREESRVIARDLGMTDLARRLGPSRNAPTALTPARDVRFEKKGALWIVALGDRHVSVKDSRGMQLLARLVERPEEEMHVLALASDEVFGAQESSAGEILDERARAQYKQRLEDLDEEIETAKKHADRGRIEKLEHEKEALVDELARATGLGGRRRVAASATERARVNVQRRLKDAIARIADVDHDLGRFFERAVRTGTFCCFRP